MGIDHDSDDSLLATYHIGQQFDEFIRSDLGRYLIGKAEQDELNLLHELQTVPAHEQNAIADLQQRSRAPRLFIEWIEEAIQAGAEAKLEYEFRIAENGGRR